MPSSGAQHFLSNIEPRVENTAELDAWRSRGCCSTGMTGALIGGAAAPGAVHPEGRRQDLSNLVNDLLDLAKVEAGKITVRPADFEVANLFGGVARHVETAPERG